MQIKLIAMDLDGTLMLPDHQRVGETTRRALAACHQQGVRLALATGRTLALTEPVQAQLPFLDYIVFSNGAGVWDVQNKKRIHSDPMQLADARQICAYLDSRPVYYEFYADGVRWHLPGARAWRGWTECRTALWTNCWRKWCTGTVWQTHWSV